MITSNELTKAIENTLTSYEKLALTNIQRSVEVNTDPAQMPWCGVYPGKFEIQPSTLGNDFRRWQRMHHPIIVLQEQSYDYFGQDATEKLDELIQHVFEAIGGEHNTGLRFNLTGVRLVGISGAFSYNISDDASGGIFSPQCEITLDVEVR